MFAKFRARLGNRVTVSSDFLLPEDIKKEVIYFQIQASAQRKAENSENEVS